MATKGRRPDRGVPEVTRVAGLDGCRAGWVVAEGAVGQGRHLTVRVVPEVATVVDALDRGALAVAGIDIPIGLPDGPGGRTCDGEARRRLGRRAVTVFTPPPRVALDAPDYPTALSRARAATGRGISIEAWNLVPRIREVDRLVTRRRRRRLVEVHPEVVFAVLAGQPLPPKRSTDGRRARLDALAPAVPHVETLLAERPTGAAPDDVLDAVAVWWSAARFARNEHEQLGGGRDGRGRPMRIVA